MNSHRHLVSHEDQFRSKELGRRMAAAAPIEEKIAKLVQLQKISSELARQTGRPAKEPWQIQVSNR
jgi:hypothetical protein